MSLCEQNGVLSVVGHTSTMADDGDQPPSLSSPDSDFDDLPIPQIDVLSTDVTDRAGEPQCQCKYRNV